jgi:small-conductance mechanosensitive channel
MNDWLLALVAIVAGIAVGLVLSRLAFGFVAASKRPVPIQQVARPISRLVFATSVVIGLLVAVGYLQPEALDELTADAIAFIPRLLVAAVIIIVANVLESFAGTAVATATARMPTQIQRQASLVVKATILALAVILAVGQLGVDTAVVNLGVAAVFFAVAASLTLLIGLGGQGVAREVAATRALRRLLDVGDKVAVDEVEGVVQSVSPTAIEVRTGDGITVLVPSSRLLTSTIAIDRTDDSVEAAEPGA